MPQAKLITLTDNRSPASEAYRTLRTNLMFSRANKPLTAFVVSATSKADDKSVVAGNLAVAFAQAGHKTLLIDADLRRPAQHTLWGVSNERGLSNLFQEDSALANPPFVPSGIDNLSILTSGVLPANPADLLSSHRMDEIIGLLKARFHILIFDAPPVLAVTDAALIGVKTDGVVLNIRAGKTRRDHSAQAKQALERVNVAVLGAVLTNARQESGQY